MKIYCIIACGLESSAMYVSNCHMKVFGDNFADLADQTAFSFLCKAVFIFLKSF